MIIMSEEIKVIKRERIANIRRFTDKILSYLTNENITKGNIIYIRENTVTSKTRRA